MQLPKTMPHSKFLGFYSDCDSSDKLAMCITAVGATALLAYWQCVPESTAVTRPTGDEVPGTHAKD